MGSLEYKLKSNRITRKLAISATLIWCSPDAMLVLYCLSYRMQGNTNKNKIDGRNSGSGPFLPLRRASPKWAYCQEILHWSRKCRHEIVDAELMSNGGPTPSKKKKLLEEFSGSRSIGWGKWTADISGHPSSSDAVCPTGFLQRFILFSQGSHIYSLLCVCNTIWNRAVWPTMLAFNLPFFLI